MATEGAPSPPQESARPALVVMQEFWGGQWPAAREEIIEVHGLAALQEAEAKEIPPFEEIADELRDAYFHLPLEKELEMARHFQRTVLGRPQLEEILREEGKAVTRENLAILEAICAEHEPFLTDLTAEHAAASQAYRRRIWDEELYYKAPAFSALMAEEFYASTKGGFGSSGGFRGWTYSYCMDPAKDAQYGWTKERLGEAVQARDALVEEAARNL